MSMYQHLWAYSDDLHTINDSFPEIFFKQCMGLKCAKDWCAPLLLEVFPQPCMGHLPPVLHGFA